jgi:hypothetical protein
LWTGEEQGSTEEEDVDNVKEWDQKLDNDLEVEL